MNDDFDAPTQSTAPAAPVDPRLARLAARSAAARAQLTPPSGVATNPTSGGFAGEASPARRPRKRHAAKGSRSAALTMSAMTTLGLAGYFQHAAAAQASISPASTPTAASSAITTAAASTAGSASTTPATQSATTASTTTASTAASATVTTAATSQAASTALADGTFVGATSTNKWGPVEVQITVAGGTITNVTTLQTPTGGKSDSINQRAVPVLNASTLTAQSAKINSVSGATYTSTSYKQSLQSALDAAAAAAHS